jgi:hypothetical protein
LLWSQFQIGIRNPDIEKARSVNRQERYRSAHRWDSESESSTGAAMRSISPAQPHRPAKPAIPVLGHRYIQGMRLTREAVTVPLVAPSHGCGWWPFLAPDPGLGAIRRPISAVSQASEAIARWSRQPGEPRDGCYRSGGPPRADACPGKGTDQKMLHSNRSDGPI